MEREDGYEVCAGNECGHLEMAHMERGACALCECAHFTQSGGDSLAEMLVKLRANCMELMRQHDEAVSQLRYYEEVNLAEAHGHELMNVERCPKCERERQREGELAAAKAALKRERAIWCDQPEDRLWHAKDRTWWRRDERGACVAADPPFGVRNEPAKDESI